MGECEHGCTVHCRLLDRCVTVWVAKGRYGRDATYIGKFSWRADLFIHGGVVQLSVRAGPPPLRLPLKMPFSSDAALHLLDVQSRSWQTPRAGTRQNVERLETGPPYKRTAIASSDNVSRMRCRPLVSRPCRQCGVGSVAPLSV